MFHRIVSVLAVGVLGAAVSAAASSTILYRWMDEAGGVHLTQGLDDIPQRFRASALPLGAVAAPPPSRSPSPEPPAPAPTAAPVIEPPPVQPGPKPPPAEALEYAAAAERYARLGLALEAKAALQKAEDRAMTSAHWRWIARGYDLIGEIKQAAEARRRAAQLAEGAR